MVPAELFYDPIGGIKYGKNIGAIGGHSNHVHVAYTNEAQLLKALAIAQGLGLHVSENPYVDKVDPVHVKAIHSITALSLVGIGVEGLGRLLTLAALRALWRSFTES
jgi:hypothetical protein